MKTKEKIELLTKVLRLLTTHETIKNNLFYGHITTAEIIALDKLLYPEEY